MGLSKRDQARKEWMHGYLDQAGATGDEFVRRSLLVLLSKQTADEQAAEYTKHLNARGFSAFDGEFGTSLAKQVRSGRRLSVKQMRLARKMLRKYWKQLALHAEEVAEARKLAA